jgi:hypothetical protein
MGNDCCESLGVFDQNCNLLWSTELTKNQVATMRSEVFGNYFLQDKRELPVLMIDVCPYLSEQQKDDLLNFLYVTLNEVAGDKL